MNQAVSDKLEKIAGELINDQDVIATLHSGEDDGVSLGKKLGIMLHNHFKKQSDNTFNSLDRAEEMRNRKEVPEDWAVQTVGSKFVLMQKSQDTKAKEQSMKEDMAAAQRGPIPAKGTPAKEGLAAGKTGEKTLSEADFNKLK